MSATHIVFVYGEDLWLVPRSGGMAIPLASPPGEESLPRFSPDGQTIAFVGNYDGNQDIYTIPISGGPATRVTFHPASELLCDWTPSGELLFSSSAYAGLERQSQLFVIKPGESMERELPVPYGTNGAISTDGTWLAYNPNNTDYRTWKRYRGGMASDIWLFNLETHQSVRMTDFEGTDTLPMWHGDKVYYLCDAGPEHRLNIWVYDTRTGQRDQVTRFVDYDCKWPAIGPGPDGQGEIVLQNGASLFLVDLASQESRAVEITVPGDRPKIRPRAVDASEFIAEANLSPTGKRLVMEARGDIWTLPAKSGSPRNLTRSSGVAERDPSWSPDGRWIAYFSDASGEYELYIMQSDGLGDAKRLTTDGNCYRYRPTWSPDSQSIVFSDKTGAIWLYSLAKEELKQLDRSPTAGPTTVSWSHNSEWIAYSRELEMRSPPSCIMVVNVRSGEQHQLTSGFFNDGNPVFDRTGDYLFFVSSRAFNAPKYEDLGTTFIYSGTQVLIALPLRKDVKYPFIEESDEETWVAEKPDSTDPTDSEDQTDQSDPTEQSDPAEETDPKDEADQSSPPDDFKPLVIEVEGAESRAFQIPVSQGNFGQLAVNDKGQLIYSRTGGRGGDTQPAIHLFDLADKKREEKKVVDDRAQFRISADGKKLLVSQMRNFWVIDAAADQKMTDQVPKSGMFVTIEPREEWAQVLREAWRIQRDFFYDPTMHGVDWPRVYQQYSSMLDDCVSRRDVSFLIAEMISELNVGHAYYREGDVERAPTANIGLLGCRLELVDDAYRIAELYRGSAWDTDARNPLELAGIQAGQFLLAINGVRLDSRVNPYSLTQRLANLTVTLSVSDEPVWNDQVRQVPVKLLNSDSELRFRGWIEAKRRHVEEQTDGRVGYIYVVNTGVPGQNDLVRQLYGQLNKEALIIDDRWNGGGQIPTRFIELLNRPATNMWARRDAVDWMWPPDSHQGPQCMLINGMAGSGGDMFPALFRQNGLGKLIGTRTWGGLVGISGGPSMIDGSSVTPPTFAYYRMDGTWGIEGHGVDPDIEVVDDPAMMVNGRDPQLDRAIQLMLEELEAGRGFKLPERPRYPDRSGFGISPEDY
ncbi:MAG TPA: S41 family peptidase [Pirellulaceae bacterium]|nr:S41 family peptidase [Pirellulaceae bacterium]